MAFTRSADGIAKKGKTDGTNLGNSGPTQKQTMGGKGKAKGTKVMDSTHANYENAKRAVTRLLSDIKGKQLPASSGASEPVVLPRGLVSGTTKKIIDSGLTQAQFNEFIAQLRASVSFQ